MLIDLCLSVSLSGRTWVPEHAAPAAGGGSDVGPSAAASLPRHHDRGVTSRSLRYLLLFMCSRVCWASSNDCFHDEKLSVTTSSFIWLSNVLCFCLFFFRNFVKLMLKQRVVCGVVQQAAPTTHSWVCANIVFTLSAAFLLFFNNPAVTNRIKCSKCRVSVNFVTLF